MACCGPPDARVGVVLCLVRIFLARARVTAFIVCVCLVSRVPDSYAGVANTPADVGDPAALLYADFSGLPWLSILVAAGLAALGSGVRTLIDFGDGKISRHEMLMRMIINLIVGSFAGIIAYALMSWWRAEVWQTFLSCCAAGLAGRIIIDKVRDWAAGKMTSKGGI